MKIDRPNLDEDLSEALVSSLYDIASDAERYDGGDMYAIKRSAITLRSLFHDTKYSHGLIQQLNLQKSMKFASFSKNYDKYKSAISFNRLIFARFKINNNVLIKNPFYDTLIFYPGDSGPDSYLTFDEWWNQPLITFKDNNTNDSISRRDLILKEANQDGPAHFDKKVDNLYLKYRNGLNSFVAGIDGQKLNPVVHTFFIGGYNFDHETIARATNPTGINLALTRQVVHEVLISFNKASRFKVKYNPDFNKLFHAKLNYFGWHLAAFKK